MEEYKFLKIRKGNVIGSYELWDSISGTLYGIDKLIKEVIIQNIDFINNSESLQSMLDFLSDKVKIQINNDYIFEQGQDGVIIVNKTNDSQFIANEIVFDIIKIIKSHFYLSQILAELDQLYFLQNEEEKIDTINCIIQLVANNILYIC
ncbi:MAG: hypothetical protein ACI4T1_03105 [Christensenellales bacterium]